ncbi:MAG: hypothetical protein JO290_01350 [Sphingomonadaceae bacterium]|nr:hypothetical protein [Sphingomonadaceae bacterium]
MTRISPTTIDVDGRGGLSIVLTFQDDAGNPRDVSAALMFFEVDGALRVPLGPGGTAAQRTLALTRDQVATIGVKYRDFAFIDETLAVADAFWTGVITVRGFVAQP